MLVLEPCLGNQQVRPGATVELRNEGDLPCEVMSHKGGSVFVIPPNQSIDLPIGANLLSKNKLQFSVLKAGRTFTVYGLVKEDAGDGRRGSVASITDENRAQVNGRLPPIERRRSSATVTFVNAEVDPMTLSTENLINERLSPKDSLSDDSTGGSPRTPHARLAALQLEAAKHSKAQAVKREIAPVMSIIADRLKEGTLKVKTEPSLYHDVGIREKLWEILDQYSGMWLHEGLLAISLGEAELGNPEAREGVKRKSLRQRVFDEMFSNQQILDEQREKRQGVFPENTEFVLKMSRHVVFKFLELVLFLDHAKQADLLRAAAGACLFKPTSEAKSSEGILTQFAAVVFAGEGDIVRNLKRMDYTVAHKQTPLDEYETRIQKGELYNKIRDGIVLSMLVRSYQPSIDVLPQMRVPAKERLHYLMNNEKILEALNVFDSSLLDTGRRGKITKYDLADGHKEKTLGFIWRLILRFSMNLLINEDRLVDEIKRISFRNREKPHWHQTMEILSKEPDAFDIAISAEDAGLDESSKIRALLLQWIQTVCAGFDRVPLVRDFSASIADGSALCALIHYYHPDVLPFEAINLPSSEPITEGDRLRRERRNFATLNAACEALGELPVRLNSCNSRNIPNPQLGFACTAFLCSRLLGTSNEIKAAKKIQAVWAAARARKTKTAESQKKARKLMREMARQRMEDVLAANQNGNLFRALNFSAGSPRAPHTPSDPMQLEVKEEEATTEIQDGDDKLDSSVNGPSVLQERDANSEMDPGAIQAERSKAMKTEQLRNLERARKERELEFEHHARQDAERRANEAYNKLQQLRASENALRERLNRAETEREAAERAAIHERREREEAEKRALREREQRDALLRETSQMRQQMEKEWALERGNTTEHLANEQSRWVELSRANAELTRILEESEQRLAQLQEEAHSRRIEAEEREREFQIKLDQEQLERLALERRMESILERAEALDREKRDAETKSRGLAETCRRLEEELRQLSSEKHREDIDEFNQQQRELQQLQVAQAKLKEEQAKLAYQQSELETAKEAHEIAMAEREQRLNEMLAEERRMLEEESLKRDQAVEDRIRAEFEFEQFRQKVEMEMQELADAKETEEAILEELRQKVEETERTLQSMTVSQPPPPPSDDDWDNPEAEDPLLTTPEWENEQPKSSLRQGPYRRSSSEQKMVHFDEASNDQRRRQSVNSQPEDDSKAQMRDTLIIWLQEPSCFANVEDVASRDPEARKLLFDRECLKAIIWALRGCKRAQHYELQSLLRTLVGVFQYEVFPNTDLTLHLANALMDVLQTFYDKPQEFGLALRVFALLWEDFKEEIDFRVQSLIELLDTKRQIQTLCGLKDSTCAMNLSRVVQALGLNQA